MGRAGSALMVALAIAGCFGGDSDGGAPDADFGPIPGDSGAAFVPPPMFDGATGFDATAAAPDGGADGDRDAGGDAAVDAGPPPPDPCDPVGDLPGVCPARGLYDSAQTVELRPVQPSDRLYFTLDGSEPTVATGIPYSGVDADGAESTAGIDVVGQAGRGVVLLRAASFDAAGTGSAIATHSYVFPRFVVSQPADPDGFPATWGAASTRPGDYEMDPDVLPDDMARGLAVDGLAALPTLSLVMEPEALFGATGIYMNPEMQGIDWERLTSAELIFADGTPGFQVDCGVRIQGGSSTQNWKSAKVSLRLLFKKLYGPGKLKFPLFADSPVAEFDTLVLDAHLNLTWTHPDHAQRIRSQYIRDTFVSDLQNAVGSLAPHDVFVHLYLNGLYWGVYDVHERADDAFAAAHLGGTEAEYDVLRHHPNNIVDGDRVAWDAMFTITRTGVAGNTEYQMLKTYLDVDDFIDYMLVNFYVGNDDWPHQNWYAARHRTNGSGYRFFSWDAEHVLKEIDVDVSNDNDANGPGELYEALLANADFQAAVTARAAQLFAAGEPLSPTGAAAIYQARLDEIDASVLLESARWGDNRSEDDPYTRADWVTERDWLLNQYFPQRSAVVMGQLP